VLSVSCAVLVSLEHLWACDSTTACAAKHGRSHSPARELNSWASGLTVLFAPRCVVRAKRGAAMK
jgi:hypothetical protein